MDKLRKVVNAFFITLYVLAALGTSLLFMFRGVNEELGLRIIEIWAPFVLQGLLIAFVLHLILSSIILAPRDQRG